MSDDKQRSNRGWFRKGQSGNPGGRPKNQAVGSGSPFDVILNRTLPVTRNGVVREVSLEEALQQRTYKEALAGKRMAIREVLRWIVRREEWLNKNRPVRLAQTSFGGIIQDPDNADEALLLLGIARENPGRSKSGGERRRHLLLEPWAVKAALGRRRGTRALTQKQVDEIRRCSHDDGTIVLPEGADE